MLLLVVTVLLQICSKTMEQYCLVDPNSFARPDQLVVTHLHLDLSVNFQNKTLSGNVIFSVKRQTDGINDLILDTRDLNIFKVTDVDTNQTLPFELVKDSETPKFLGHKLVIKLADAYKNTYNVSVHYETSPKSSGLQWLLPEQTAGKQFPYLFSQSQAIHARSIFPCQDTPSVKATYTASISALKAVTVLMSAVKDKAVLSAETGTMKHTFNQKVPIPSYLIAIVVGALENRKISDRIDIWSEKEMIEKAAYEFAEAEKMLTIAENLIGPYIWGRYDILVLPPSFPFGGMENPCLTFVTPTLLAGDRSLADVVAHEISHSWTGNLVTNINFEHFWLNEGFTVYLERLIDGEMYGEKHRQFKSIGGWKVLLDEIQALGETAPFTKLIVDLKEKDPDDSFSSVPYEKGYAFLYYLEQKVGGRENFTKFLRDYIEKYKYQSIDSETWKKYFLNYFSNNKEVQSVDFDSWLNGSGLPPVTPNYDQTLELACLELSKKWMAAKEPSDFEEFSINDIKGLHSAQIVEFLTLIRQEETLPIKTLENMEAIYKFNSVENSEIRSQWIRLGLQSHWKEIVPLALTFVVEQGRMKFLKPTYRDLYSWEETRQLAIDTFLKHKDEMMYQSENAVAKELHVKI